MFDREERGGTAGRDVDLCVDVLHVVICSLIGDHQPVGDLLRGKIVSFRGSEDTEQSAAAFS